MARIYVSSTFSDLRECREQVRTVLRRLGHEDVAMEYYVAESERPTQRCLSDVAGCDLYIGIFALRYGYVVPTANQSVTELEAEEAARHGKDCLVFILKDGASWPTDRIEFAAYPRILALRQKLESRHVCSYFSDANDLQARVAEAIAQWDRDHGRAATPQTDWDAYKRAVVEEHQWVRLAVIAGAKQEQIARIPLADVFVPQNLLQGQPTFEVPDDTINRRVALFEQADAQSRKRSERHTRRSQDSLVLFPEAATEVLGRERGQVVLGGPGSGKSTLLHFALLGLASSGANGTVPHSLRAQPIPFLIELRQYTLRGVHDFVDYIADSARARYGVELTRSSIEALLNKHEGALVCFDGLDEIFDVGERARAVERFRAFRREYRSCSVIITSRIVGYDATALDIHDFRHYTILDFTADQIRTFVNRWYQFYTWQGDPRDAAGLVGRMLESRRLMELGGNPLLLTMMAILYKHQDLPEQRWLLYERCTEVLLEQWDIKRKSISHRMLLPIDVAIRAPQKAELLSRVAIFMLDHGQPGRELNAIAQQPLMDIISQYFVDKYAKPQGEAETIAAEVLNHLRERTYILAEIGDRVFGFVHRTFMEYFAACHCRAEFNAKRSDYSWLANTIMRSHWSDDYWQEVLLLLLAMLSDQGSPVEEVIDALKGRPSSAGFARLTFSARCVAELSETKTFRLRHVIARALGERIVYFAERYKSVDPKIQSGLAALFMIGYGQSDTSWCQQLIARLRNHDSRRLTTLAWQLELALRPREARLSFAMAGLEHDDDQVRIRALSWMEHEFSDQHHVADRMLEVASRDRIARVRQAALSSLSRMHAGDDAVLHAIEARVTEESAYTHVQWLMQHVARHWSNSPRGLDVILGLSALMPLARGEYDYHAVHQTCAQCVHEYWQHDERLSSHLVEIAFETYDKYVCRAAAWALGTAFPPDSRIFHQLRDTVQSQLDPGIRARALGIIGHAWPRQSSATDTLCEALSKDTIPGVRAAAAAALSCALERTTDRFLSRDQQPRTEQNITALRRALKHDTNRLVRAHAILALRKLDAWEDFITVGFSVDDPAVRCFAIATAFRMAEILPVLHRVASDLPCDLLDAAVSHEWNSRAKLELAAPAVAELAATDRDPNVRECAAMAPTFPSYTRRRNIGSPDGQPGVTDDNP